MIGVKEMAINHWETKKTEPEPQYYPKIMEFLGYCPVQYPMSFGDHIRIHRMHRGYSMTKLAQKFGVDPTTVSNWEKDTCEPHTYPLYSDGA